MSARQASRKGSSNPGCSCQGSSASNFKAEHSPSHRRSHEDRTGTDLSWYWPQICPIRSQVSRQLADLVGPGGAAPKRKKGARHAKSCGSDGRSGCTAFFKAFKASELDPCAEREKTGCNRAHLTFRRVNGSLSEWGAGPTVSREI